MPFGIIRVFIWDQPITSKSQNVVCLPDYNYTQFVVDIKGTNENKAYDWLMTASRPSFTQP